jgi:Tol biopolymer transport system component
VTIAEEVQHSFNKTYIPLNSAAAQFSFSESGHLVYASGGVTPDPIHQLFWVDRNGKSEPVTGFGKKAFDTPQLAPDGTRLAFAGAFGDTQSIWVFELSRGGMIRVQSEGLAGVSCWFPGGQKLAIASNKGGITTIWLKTLDGIGEMEKLAEGPRMLCPSSFTPDGKYLALVRMGPPSRDILILGMEDRQITPIITTGNGACPQFSPDGRWLAYTSAETGRREVYLCSFPGGANRKTVSVDGGHEPLWNPNGRELFFGDIGRSKLMKVDIVTEPSHSVGIPRVVFEFRGVINDPTRGYDVSPDGKRFLVQGPLEYSPMEINQLKLVQNWFEELKRLVPIK